MGKGIICDFFKKTIFVELAYVKRKPYHFIAVKVIVAGRVVFVFLFAMVGPLRTFRLKRLENLRKLPGFSP